MLARREWAREWWDDHRLDFEVVASEAVIDELESGDFPQKDDALSLIAPIPTLEFDAEKADIVDAYVARHIMPADPKGDALHLALASFHRCDFLLTWNCRHLANANKFFPIRRVNGILGLFVPALVTPLELLTEGSEQRPICFHRRTLCVMALTNTTTYNAINYIVVDCQHSIECGCSRSAVRKL